eukprot:GHVU01136600.1.p1 GENE.GHVU01136600.1~~GHVU01136600.1.p1  ORF type:complete len:113 (-),score=6.40 GHVU01136600.1:13-351(-)
MNIRLIHPNIQPTNLDQLVDLYLGLYPTEAVSKQQRDIFKSTEWDDAFKGLSASHVGKIQFFMGAEYNLWWDITLIGTKGKEFYRIMAWRYHCLTPMETVKYGKIGEPHTYR